jgi:hypothetical protein
LKILFILRKKKEEFMIDFLRFNFLFETLKKISIFKKSKKVKKNEKVKKIKIKKRKKVKKKEKVKS